jgi:hypothetical protein
MPIVHHGSMGRRHFNHMQTDFGSNRRQYFNRSNMIPGWVIFISAGSHMLMDLAAWPAPDP